MIDAAGQHISDGLDASMRMPGEAGAVFFRPVVAEIVEQQERIEFGGVAEAESAAQMHACALECGLGRDNALDGADRHGGSSPGFA